jgi:hypothetical protein
MFKSVGLFFFVLVASAQEPQFATITGRVIDDSTSAPLPNVNVYLANTTLGGNTNEKGIFEIHNIPFSTYDLVASRIGYSLHSSRLSVREPRQRDVEIRLKPINVEMDEVVVSAPDPTEWRAQLRRFNDLFLGTTRNAKECRITNPEVLDFKATGLDFLEATARRPLEIENGALGYHLQIYLRSFKVENETMRFEGLPKFTELVPSTPAEEARRKENRMRAYHGSLRHFLIALFKKELNRVGYSISHVDFLETNGVASSRKILTEDDILFASPWATQKTLRVSGYLEVEYRGDVEEGYNLLRKPGALWQVSWLSLNYLSLSITERGYIIEPFPTRVVGYWSWRRLADMLPLDYVPEKE